jgi:hypothetical protein
MWAMPADQMIQSGFDCLNRIDRLDQDPNLNHVARFGVLTTGGETSGNDDTEFVLMDDVPV